MTPSIFNNEYSRGPLYQYWKERSAEEKTTRDQRIEEAKIRSKGFQPFSPTPGPSSQDSYMRRATSGPPGYVAATTTGRCNGGERESMRSAFSSEPETTSNAASAAAARPNHGDLPSYVDATRATAAAGPTPSQPSASQAGGSQGERQQSQSALLSSAEDKARLAQLEAQRRQIDEDAGMARTVSAASEVEAGERQLSTASDTSQGTPRRKSTASKVGRWLADAATGFSKKQERF
ncbi:uncharacterized protein A1O9_01320 [Exophiala aquamarina CBS 119918]|uniref:Uncharacterized protein n=1 Tax=Exophiala aquamarina CBS 119918 TaxID=1182545 RepID=A0A072PVJ1_9EURO|nr:uncharacterized protein A1O9_01320 [Exophiala aquamarina CBS 119918]KEF63343.1 hypothetical protein A1O9_01320 [Exophiala aquamarina CBS 119918]